jgi:hypothetical protein
VGGAHKLDSVCVAGGVVYLVLLGLSVCAFPPTGVCAIVFARIPHERDCHDDDLMQD